MINIQILADMLDEEHIRMFGTLQIGHMTHSGHQGSSACSAGLIPI